MSGTKYTVRLRRRRAGKTDYNKRMKLVLSGKARLVIRKTSNNFYVQIAEYKKDGDKIITSANAKELEKMGWKFSKKNIPAAYLVGMLAAKKALKNGLKEAILDSGLLQPTKGGKTYSALKGAIDGGLKIPAGEEIFPSDARIKGEHVAAYLDKYKNIVSIFEEIKKKIEGM